MPHPLIAKWVSKFGGLRGPSRCIGLDGGSLFIKGVRLQKGESGIRLLQSESAEVPAGSDPKRRAALLREVAEKLGCKESPVVASVGGPSTVLRHVSFPKMSPQELRAALSFEAEKHIPFKLDEVFFDFSVLQETSSRSPGQMEVLLAAARKELVGDLLNALSPSAAAPLAVELEAAALANAWEAAPLGEPKGVVGLLHIGNRGTVLDFLRDSRLEFSREISVGGAAFARAMGGTLRLDPSEEQRIQCQPAWEDWLVQCRASFDFYENQSGRRIERLVLSGGAAPLAGFQEWVREASALPTQIWKPMGAEPSYAVAVGLALQGVAG